MFDAPAKRCVLDRCPSTVPLLRENRAKLILEAISYVGLRSGSGGSGLAGVGR
jgi:hypothetical protein